MRKALAIHPFFFAVFPILFLFEHNIAEVPKYQVTAPLLISLGATAVLLAIIRSVVRNTLKAGMIVSLALVIFFNYGRAQLPWLAVALLVAGTFLTVRSKRNLAPPTNLLNITIGIMVALSLIGIGAKTRRAADVWNDLGISADAAGEGAIPVQAPESLPDFYYIVLDSYPRADTLRDVYRFDNSEFLGFLEKRGFFVADESRANYAQTYNALASSLNMEHIDYLSEKLGTETRNTAVPARMIEENKVMKYAKGLGYKTVHFRSGWSGTDHNRYADLGINYGGANEFTMLLVQTTALKPLDAKLGLVQMKGRERILSIFRRLGEMPKLKGPTFTFAHLETPHPPYYFDARGAPVKRPKLQMQGRVWAQKQKYLDQLAFVNDKVKVTVDEILEKSDRPPIIILQSDHGSASTFYTEKKGTWVKPTNLQLRERMRILNALYAPEIDRGKLRPDLSPVNNFRLVFNEYFGANFELLEDKSLYSHYQAPYAFEDLTERVKGRPRLTE